MAAASASAPDAASLIADTVPRSSSRPASRSLALELATLLCHTARRLDAPSVHRSSAGSGLDAHSHDSRALLDSTVVVTSTESPTALAAPSASTGIQFLSTGGATGSAGHAAAVALPPARRPLRPLPSPRSLPAPPLPLRFAAAPWPAPSSPSLPSPPAPPARTTQCTLVRRRGRREAPRCPPPARARPFGPARGPPLPSPALRAGREGFPRRWRSSTKGG